MTAALLLGALSGCATRHLPGYQNTYQGHQIPQSLLDAIRQRFRQHGLVGAEIGQDSVGRVRLMGSYEDEDQVDAAFVIVQTLVGLKSTSPFYPEQVRQRRWEQVAGQALKDFARQQRAGSGGAPGVRRAVVVGINTFRDPAIPPIQGADDAHVVAEQLTRFGYVVSPLIGPAATKAAIESAIAKVSSELAPDDTLFIYVSSHGTQPVPSARGGDERKMSIVAYDSQMSIVGGRGDGVDSALQVQRTSVRDTLLQELAQRPTRVTRVLIDTCYSGEILRGVPESSREFVLRQNGGRAERAGVSVAAWSGPAYAAKAIRFVGPDGKQAVKAAAAPVAAAVPQRSGYTLITATSEDEKAYGPAVAEGTFPSPLAPARQLRGSFFTQAFMAWLEFYQGRLRPAFEQASHFTKAKVSQFGERQTPLIYSTLPAADDNLRVL